MRPAMEQCKTQNQQFLGFLGSMSNYDCSQVEKTMCIGIRYCSTSFKFHVGTMDIFPVKC